MSDLMLITAGLCGLAALFLLVLPRFWTRRVEGDSVDDWLSVRQAETDDASLLNDAQLRAWDDKDQKADDLVIRGASQRWGYQVVLMCLLVAATVALYGRLGAYEDVQIARAIASLESATPDEVTTLITRIEARSSQRPNTTSQPEMRKTRCKTLRLFWQRRPMRRTYLDGQLRQSLLLTDKS